MQAPDKRAARPPLPGWAQEIVALYESGSAAQFILYGNVADLFLLPDGSGALGSLSQCIQKLLLQRFDVVLSFDVGNGIRIEKGQEVFATWPQLRQNPELPRSPLPAIDTLTHYFRYCANLAALSGGKGSPIQVACFVRDASLVASNDGGSFEASAIVLLLRDWACEEMLHRHPLATFILSENVNDLHRVLVNNPRAAKIKVPLPTATDLEEALRVLLGKYPKALSAFADRLAVPAHQLAGAQLSTIDALLRRKEHEASPLAESDLVTLKKRLVESDCNGLIEFIESKRNLDDLHGQEQVKEWLRQDIALWKTGDLSALPMGYLLCGPVGTGKTFMVECLAGEAAVPVVKIKNFRDRWVGSSEGNLERIFRLLHALGRCIVFIDEADQALGKRDSGSNDSGLSGRIYAMVAEEMSNPANRGSIMWVLASSRPDLIEVDLKRPGRVDVKIPLFPTGTVEESVLLLRALAKKRRLELPDPLPDDVRANIPCLLTPGAAEALIGKVYRITKTRRISVLDSLRESLTDYQPPVDPQVIRSQITLALKEATDRSFIPKAFRIDNATSVAGPGGD